MLVIACALLVAAFALHWIAWKIHVPGRANLFLLLIHAGVLAAGLLALHVAGALRPYAPHGWLAHIRIILFYVAFTLVYIINYSGLEEDSPSFTLVKFVALSGERGRERSEFGRVITDEMILHSRLRALVQGRLVDRVNDRYVLTPRGKLLNELFSWWRAIFRIRGGG